MKALFAIAMLLAAPAPVTKIERKATIVSSDGVLTAKNADAGDGGTMPNLVTTLAWKDASGKPRELELREESRIGWVESIGVIPTRAGGIYVVIAEDKLATTTYSLELRAYRFSADRTTLEEAADFFPSLEAEGERSAALSVEYPRRRGIDVFPRPVEARVDEDAKRISLALFPTARNVSKAAAGSVSTTPSSVVDLTLDGVRIAPPALNDAARSLLVPE